MSNINPKKFAPDNRSPQEMAKEILDTNLSKIQICRPSDEGDFAKNLEFTIEFAKKMGDEERANKFGLPNFIEQANGLIAVLRKIAESETPNLSSSDKVFLSKALIIAQGVIEYYHDCSERTKTNIRGGTGGTFGRLIRAFDGVEVLNSDQLENANSLEVDCYYASRNISNNTRTHTIPTLQALARTLGVHLDTTGLSGMGEY